MFHYFYVIENLINGKIYAGKHSTKDFDDGYMGSGTLIRRAIKKHDVKNFRKHVLKMCESAKELNELERFIVDEDFVNDENTYNLELGGKGSFLRANQFYKDHPEKRREQLRFSLERAREIQQNDPIIHQKMQQTRSDTFKRLHAEGHLHPVNWIGRHHKEETKRKIGQANSVNQTGMKNSNFGKVWINNHELQQSKSVPKLDIDTWLQQGWVRGRKIKW